MYSFMIGAISDGRDRGRHRRAKERRIGIHAAVVKRRQIPSVGQIGSAQAERRVAQAMRGPFAADDLPKTGRGRDRKGIEFTPSFTDLIVSHVGYTSRFCLEISREILRAGGALGNSYIVELGNYKLPEVFCG